MEIMNLLFLVVGDLAGGQLGDLSVLDRDDCRSLGGHLDCFKTAPLYRRCFVIGLETLLDAAKIDISSLLGRREAPGLSVWKSYDCASRATVVNYSLKKRRRSSHFRFLGILTESCYDISFLLRQ